METLIVIVQNPYLFWTPPVWLHSLANACFATPRELVELLPFRNDFSTCAQRQFHGAWAKKKNGRFGGTQGQKGLDKHGKTRKKCISPYQLFKSASKLCHVNVRLQKLMSLLQSLCKTSIDQQFCWFSMNDTTKNKPWPIFMTIGCILNHATWITEGIMTMDVQWHPLLILSKCNSFSGQVSVHPYASTVFMSSCQFNRSSFNKLFW